LSANTCCNWRAGIFLLVLPMVLMVLVVPVWAVGYWYDAAGVEADSLGYAITGLPDLNGDGFDEFLVGVPGSDAAGQDAGRVMLWYGGSGEIGAQVTIAPDSSWTGMPLEKFGWAVAGIGDVNRDGFADWAVGAPKSNLGGTARGRIYIFFGGDPAVGPALAPQVIAGAQGGDHFGFAISAAGDFNGDNYDDFIVGAPFANPGNGLSGAAYVIYGKAGGPSADLADATVLAGEVAGDNFGWSVTDVGNFFGGTTDCVAVGAPLADGHGGTDAGAVFVYAGGSSPDGIADFVTGSSAAAAPNSQFGYEVRGAGHLDADTAADLAVGAPFSNAGGSAAGRVEIFYGAANPSLTADHFINGATAGDHFGWALDRIGDVSGSPRDDLLIGAPDVLTSAGQAYIYEGGSSSTTAGALTTIANSAVNPGTEANDKFGWAVASAGDFDGDSLPDYVIAAPGGNNGETNAQSGFAMLVHSSAGPVPALLRNWQARWRDNNLVDLAFELTWPGESLVGIELTRRVLDTDGLVRNEALLWSGPAQRVADGGANVLVHRGSGFGYVDDVSAVLNSGITISYALRALGADGESLRLDGLSGPGILPAVVPASLELAPAWPNPANPAVNIRFRAATGAVATIRLVDLRGRMVRELHAAPGLGDWQTVIWNGLTDSGRAAASGVYLIRLESGGQLRTERVTLAR